MFDFKVLELLLHEFKKIKLVSMGECAIYFSLSAHSPPTQKLCVLTALCIKSKDLLTGPVARLSLRFSGIPAPEEPGAEPIGCRV